jgi:hypothetical protein
MKERGLNRRRRWSSGWWSWPSMVAIGGGMVALSIVALHVCVSIAIGYQEKGNDDSIGQCVCAQLDDPAWLSHIN